MYRGLVVSVVLHAGILGWALVSIEAATPPKPPEPEPLSVAIITADEITRLKKGDRSAKQLDAQRKEAPQPEAQPKERPKPKPVVAAPPPPAPEPEPPQPPEPAKTEPAKVEPQPKPPEPAKAEPTPQADPIADKIATLAPPAPARPQMTPEQRKKRAEAKKKAREEARKKEEAERKRREREKKLAEERKRKQEFDPDRLAALLNKIPDAGAPAPAVEPSETPSKNTGPVAGAPEGRDTRLTASEMALLAAAMKRGVQPCWRVLGGGMGADATIVKLRIQLNQDGTLKRDPEIMNPQASPFFAAAADSARRAVMQCQPYTLPPARYAAWQDMILNFDPREMF